MILLFHLWAWLIWVAFNNLFSIELIPAALTVAEELHPALVLQQSPEVVRAQSYVLGDVPHRKGVDGVVAGDLDHEGAVTHGDVLALADHVITELAEYPDRVFLADPGELRHNTASLP